jgi:hypothetical protein
MSNSTFASSPLNIVALGWALSVALVVLFVICLVVGLVLPDWPASHGWISFVFRCTDHVSQSLVRRDCLQHYFRLGQRRCCRTRLQSFDPALKSRTRFI